MASASEHYTQTPETALERFRNLSGIQVVDGENGPVYRFGFTDMYGGRQESLQAVEMKELFDEMVTQTVGEVTPENTVHSEGGGYEIYRYHGIDSEVVGFYLRGMLLGIKYAPLPEVYIDLT